MNYFYFVGLDVSKSTFDASILDSNEIRIAYRQFSNNDSGILTMLKWLSENKLSLDKTLICAEAMGVYVSTLCVASLREGFNFALASPLAIKRSMGIARGKNDKIDSYRIALYALNHHKRLTLYTPLSNTVEQLRKWLTIRENLVKSKVATTILIRTMRADALGDGREQIELLTHRKESTCEEIEFVESKMLEIITCDESVSKNYSLLCSVKGVGLIVATVLICTTGNFTRFADCRKYACYCGVAPFEHTSGVSLRGKTKVSALSAVRVKTYITRSALSAKVHDLQTRQYFNRKVAEGKHPASVLNVIKNKIIARCFAVVRRGTPYVSLQL